MLRIKWSSSSLSISRQPVTTRSCIIAISLSTSDTTKLKTRAEKRTSLVIMNRPAVAVIFVGVALLLSITSVARNAGRESDHIRPGALDRRAMLLEFSVPEAQSRRGSDVVVLEKGVRQSAIELRAHEADVDIPFRGKLPIDDAGDRV